MTGRKGLIEALFSWGSRNRIFFSGLLGIGFFLLARPTTLSLLSGIPLILAGEALRVWASGYITKNARLTVEGPYSLSRNPLYVGNFLLGAGFVLSSGVLWLSAVYVILFFGLYRHTVQNEERHLEKKFPVQWGKYREAVPRFAPVRGMPRYVAGNFQWKLVAKHREINNWIVMALVYGLLLGKCLLLRG